jgi:hypothetical protein
MPKKKNRTRKIFENMEIESAEVNAESTKAVTADAEHDTPVPDPHQENEEGIRLDVESPSMEPATDLNMEIESAEMNAESTESANADAEHETPISDSNQENQQEVPVQMDGPSAEQSNTDLDDETPDDLLDDVRRSLIEDEAQGKEEQPKWWRRIGKGSRKNTVAAETPKAVEEIKPPGLDATKMEQQEVETEAQEEYLDQIDELIDLLDTDDDLAEKPVAVVEETPAEPEKVIDIEELKKQAFQARPSDEAAENLSEVRSIALEGGEEVFVEVQSTTHDPLEERLTAIENALKPYRRYINFTFAFLGLVMAVVAGVLLFNAYQRSLPETAVEEVSDLPFPTSISLPGGWMFNLGKGSLADGNWHPQGAEWLQGTEVCRWVALPWSRQLEAVIRTLDANDPIELGMSNSDKLVYKVYSVRRMSVDEMRELDDNSPCLLIVLTENDSQERWVLTALP